MSEGTVRTARVKHRCANAGRASRGVEWAQICKREIAPGEQYREGEMNPYEAGGYGYDRYCMACVEAGVA